CCLPATSCSCLESLSCPNLTDAFLRRIERLKPHSNYTRDDNGPDRRTGPSAGSVPFGFQAHAEEEADYREYGQGQQRQRKAVGRGFDPADEIRPGEAAKLREAIDGGKPACGSRARQELGRQRPEHAQIGPEEE